MLAAVMSAGKKPKNPDEAALRDLGLSWPETTEDFPWGHRTLKDWLEESYCAVAPKKLGALVAGGAAASAPPTAKRPSAKKKAKARR